MFYGLTLLIIKKVKTNFQFLIKMQPVIHYEVISFDLMKTKLKPSHNNRIQNMLVLPWTEKVHYSFYPTKYPQKYPTKSL